jgi:uroporphyrinogen-III decarboxylase
MTENITPRQAVKDLLQGIAPQSPLFLPIVFSLGARIENLSLRSFLSNPTKISNSLRQIRARARSEGITCYCDPYLEAQALGAVVDWESDDRPRGVRWPDARPGADISSRLSSPDDAAKSQGVVAGVEVIRRLKSLVRDGTLLTACVTGPRTLVSLVVNENESAAAQSAASRGSNVEFAAAVVSRIASAFAEAGANAVFIREDVLPADSPEAFANWLRALATAINIIRFYEALPVLVVTNPGVTTAKRVELLNQLKDCVVCFVLGESAGAETPGSAKVASSRAGLALPPELFDPAGPASNNENLRQLIAEQRPALITTAGDVPPTADVKRLNQVWEILHC